MSLLLVGRSATFEWKMVHYHFARELIEDNRKQRLARTCVSIIHMAGSREPRVPWLQFRVCEVGEWARSRAE